LIEKRRPLDERKKRQTGVVVQRRKKEEIRRMSVSLAISRRKNSKVVFRRFKKKTCFVVATGKTVWNA
jgi:hypothetical protein